MAEAKAQVRCPHCTRMADPDKIPGEGDIICVQCGLNLLTGQKILSPGGGVREIAPRKPRALWLYAAAPALVLLLAAALGAAYYLTRDPVAEATALAISGNTLEATRLTDLRLEQNPTDLRARMLRGRLAWRAQDYARATQDFTAILDLEPRNEQAAALAMLSVSRLSGPNALQQQTGLYQRVLETQPENRTAQHLLALALGASGRLEEQIAAMDRLEAQGAGDDPFLMQMRGAALALLGRRSEAELSFASAANAGDTGGLATLAQGLLASMNGDAAKAEQLLSASNNTAGEAGALAGARLGLLQMARGEYEPAVGVLRRAADAGNEEARFFHAVALRQVRLTQEATAALTAIRDKGSKFAASAALELALMALESGNVDQAEENLRQAANAGDTSARYQTMQGKLYLAQGRDAEALQTFRQAIHNQPDYAPAHLEQGLLHVKNGMTDDGIASLEKYIELAGDTIAGAVPEVRLLVSQLKQTAPAPAGAPR